MLGEGAVHVAFARVCTLERSRAWMYGCASAARTWCGQLATEALLAQRMQTLLADSLSLQHVSDAALHATPYRFIWCRACRTSALCRSTQRTCSRASAPYQPGQVTVSPYAKVVPHAKVAQSLCLSLRHHWSLHLPTPPSSQGCVSEKKLGQRHVFPSSSLPSASSSTQSPPSQLHSSLQQKGWPSGEDHPGSESSRPLAGPVPSSSSSKIKQKQ